MKGGELYRSDFSRDGGLINKADMNYLVAHVGIVKVHYKTNSAFSELFTPRFTCVN